MLYRNDERYVMPEAEKTKLFERLGWSIKGRNQKAVFRMPSELVKFDKSNNRKVFPSRIHIPMAEKVYTEKEGAVKWNYSEYPPEKDDKGNLRYRTKIMPFNQELIVTQEKFELAYFLVYCSSVRKPDTDEAGNLMPGEKDINGKKLFYLQNRGAEARKKLINRELRTEVESLIIGRNAWPESEIRKYAIAFGVTVNDEDDISIIKSDLLGQIEGRKNGYFQFLELTRGKDEMEAMYEIEQALQKQLIGINEKKNGWAYKNKNGVFMKDLICTLRVNCDAKMSLALHLKDFPEDFEALKMANRSGE